MTRSSWKKAVGIACVGVLMACSDAALVAPSATPAAAMSREDFLASSVAKALGDPGVRSATFKAWRASTITAHKLLLTEFVASADGAPLRAALAKSWQMDEDAVLTRIKSYGSLDFFVPIRNDRREWKGDANFVVGAARDSRGDATLTFSANGPAAYDARASVRPAYIRLASARTSAERVNPQPAREGAVIQDSDDGELSGTYSWQMPGGEYKTVPMALILGTSGRRGGADGPRLSIQPPPDCQYPYDCGGGGGGSTTKWTIIRHMKVRNVCDNTPGCESNEFQFYADLWSNTGALLGRGNMSIYDTPPDYDWYNLQLVPFTITATTQTMIVNVRESDGSWGNENFGDHNLTLSSNTAGYPETVSNGFYGGNYTCDYIGYRGSRWNIPPDNYCVDPNVPMTRQVSVWYMW